ncbi:MAG: FAD binding domain-containing protein [Planctomycetes bacterium]|nr:FAD binding domain-containing protein [Planctomycetota bacterium]
MSAPSPFYHEPATEAEALQLLAALPGRAHPAMWGLYPTDVPPGHPCVSVRGIPSLSRIRPLGGRGVLLGSMSTLAEVESSPVVRRRLPSLAMAVRRAAPPLLRNRMTLFGLWLTGSPALWTLFQVLGARLGVRTRAGLAWEPVLEDGRLARPGPPARGGRGRHPGGPRLIARFEVVGPPRGARVSLATEVVLGPSGPELLAVAVLLAFDARTKRCPHVRIAYGSPVLGSRRAAWAENRVRDDVPSLRAMEEATANAAREAAGRGASPLRAEHAELVRVLLRRALLCLLSEVA